MTRKERIEAFANRMCRGSEQCYYARRLLRDEECVNPIRALRGRAKNYAGSYYRSWINMLDRIQRAGVVVKKTGGGRSWESGCWEVDRESLDMALPPTRSDLGCFGSSGSDCGRFRDNSMIAQIVGKVNVGQTDEEVLAFAKRKLKQGVWSQKDAAWRRDFECEVLRVHRRNQDLYRAVMRGRF